MPIAAAVVGNGGVTARRVGAACNMPAEGRRPAALDGVHHLHLGVTEVTLIGTTPSRAVIAEDLRDLQRWTAHVYRRLLRRVLLGSERRELIERAQHIAQNLAGDVGVACRRIEPPGLCEYRHPAPEGGWRTSAATYAATPASRSPPHPP